MQEITDDGFKVPIGRWVEQFIDWLDNNLQWLFDGLAWPFDQAMELMHNADDEFIVIPRLVMILVLGFIAYLSGDVRRVGAVTGAVGLLALLGNTTWRDSMFTMYALIIVLIAIAVLASALLALIGAVVPTGMLAPLRTALTGWAWLHPFGLMLPAIYFFGIGSTASLVLTTFMVLPIALVSSLADEPAVDLSFAQRIDRTRVGLQASVFPASLLLGIFAYIGMGGLGFPLFRALSNQDLALGSQSMVALLLVGVALWALLGQWNFDHLPGRTNNRADEVTGDMSDSGALTTV